MNCNITDTLHATSIKIISSHLYSFVAFFYSIVVVLYQSKGGQGGEEKRAVGQQDEDDDEELDKNLYINTHSPMQKIILHPEHVELT